MVSKSEHLEYTVINPPAFVSFDSTEVTVVTFLVTFKVEAVAC